jgi:hypothetical protein
MPDSKNLKNAVQRSKNQDKNQYERMQTHKFGKIRIYRVLRGESEQRERLTTN